MAMANSKGYIERQGRINNHSSLDKHKLDRWLVKDDKGMGKIVICNVYTNPELINKKVRLKIEVL